jgi:hypothetical protein
MTIFAGLACMAATSGAAWAQASPGGAPAEGPGEPPIPPKQLKYIQPPWHIQFEPEVWYVAPGGTLRLPGGSAEENLANFNLDNPRVSPLGSLSVREGDWRLAVGGMAFSTNDRGSVQGDSGNMGGQPFVPGTPVTSSLDFTTFQMEAAYRLPVSGLLAGDPIPDFYATWEAVGGVRFFDVDFNLRFPTGDTGVHEFFASPVIGVRLAMEMTYGFTIELEGDIGAFGDGGNRTVFTDDIVVGIMWRPQENIGVRVGYRQVAFTLASGDGNDKFRWDGALAGLHAGVVLRF